MTDSSEAENALSWVRSRTVEGQLRARLADALRDLEDRQAQLDLLTAARAMPLEKLQPKAQAGKRHGCCAVVAASDWHIGEVVRSEEVNGLNSYDLTTARSRAREFFEGVAAKVRGLQQVVTIRDLCLWLGGDLITGGIHDELRETNSLTPVEEVLELCNLVSGGIDFLRRELGLDRVLVVGNHGNHGRLTHKTRIKRGSRHSLEWLAYHQLAGLYRGDQSIRFAIADGHLQYVELYGQTVRFTHGDSVQYAGGVGGVAVPLNKKVARWDSARRADLTVLGHFHQMQLLSRVLVNGSLIGYGEFSQWIGASPEQPQQGFFVIDRTRGLRFYDPIWVR